MVRYTRRLDELNRLILPKDIRNFGWTEKTQLDISLLEDGVVLIRTHSPLCALCGATGTELIKAGKGGVCGNCLRILTEEADNCGISDQEAHLRP